MLVSKYELTLERKFTLTMPSILQFMGLHKQNDKPIMFVLVQPDSVFKEYNFITVEANEPINGTYYNLFFIGTWITHGGVYAQHLFCISKELD